MRRTNLLILAATMGLAACGGSGGTSENNVLANESANAMGGMANSMAGSMMSGNNMAAAAGGAIATLTTAGGGAAGTARIEPTADGLQVRLAVENIPAGEHGVHVHAVGKCEGPTFESAGGHWNPGNAKHGLENMQGQHAGDMPNLTVGSDGKGTLTYALKGGSLAELLDADGAAFVVHAKKDDQKTDPSGESGDRIACGVFSAG